jgi:hypothetical protein
VRDVDLGRDHGNGQTASEPVFRRPFASRLPVRVGLGTDSATSR